MEDGPKNQVQKNGADRNVAFGRSKFIMFKGEEGRRVDDQDGKTFLKDEDTPYATDQKYDNVFLYGKKWTTFDH